LQSLEWIEVFFRETIGSAVRLWVQSFLAEPPFCEIPQALPFDVSSAFSQKPRFAKLPRPSKSKRAAIPGAKQGVPTSCDPAICSS
jgi:hypothetical protein